MDHDAGINNISQRPHSKFFVRETLQDAISEVGGFTLGQRAVLIAFTRSIPLRPEDAMHPTVAALAKRTGCTARGVRLIVRQLEESTALVRCRDASPRAAASYRFGPPILAAYQRLLAGVDQRREERRSPLPPTREERRSPLGRNVVPPSSTERSSTERSSTPLNPVKTSTTDSEPRKTKADQPKRYRFKNGKYLDEAESRTLQWLAENADSAQVKGLALAELQRREAAEERAAQRRSGVMGVEDTERYLAKQRGHHADPQARARGIEKLREEIRRFQDKPKVREHQRQQQE